MRHAVPTEGIGAANAAPARPLSNGTSLGCKIRMVKTPPPFFFGGGGRNQCNNFFFSDDSRFRVSFAYARVRIYPGKMNDLPKHASGKWSGSFAAASWSWEDSMAT